MLRYTIKRLVQGIVTVWFIATATFFAMHSVPGDPLQTERVLDPESMANVIARHGLDKPLFEQYLHFMGNIVLRGDFGISFRQPNREVNDIIRERFRVSAELGLIAIAIAAFGGILFGALTALYRNRLPDLTIMFLVIISISVPNFVFAALAQVLIGRINDLPGFTQLNVGGWYTVWDRIVPALVLGLGTMAFLTRVMRSSMLEITGSDFVRTAWAKGLSPMRVFRKHQLRNSVLPVVTVLGPSIATITTGSLVVEHAFAIPGLGESFVDAVVALDYTMIMGITVFYGAYLVFMVIVVDLVYGFIDPRVRLE